MAMAPDPTTPVDEELSGSRRRFLRRGAAAAAAAAAAGVVMSQPAGAANGQAILIGQGNSGTAGTTLSGSSFGVSINQASANALAGANIGSGGVGVHGSGGTDTITGTGVVGVSTIGTGVKGSAPYGVGVHGEAGSTTLAGIGLRGTSAVGPQLLLDPNSLPGPPASSVSQGSFVARAGELWYATATGSGAAAGWVRLSSVLQPLPSPVRAYDSRVGTLPATGPKTQITAGVNRNVDLTGAGLLPTTAKAALINLTVANTSAAGGFLKVFKAGAAVPTGSNINWSSAGQSIANSTLVAVDAAGLITVRCGGTGAATDFIVDIIAFSL